MVMRAKRDRETNAEQKPAYAYSASAQLACSSSPVVAVLGRVILSAVPHWASHLDYGGSYSAYFFMFEQVAPFRLLEGREEKKGKDDWS